jgi:SAM-dependent methyltransferase
LGDGGYYTTLARIYPWYYNPGSWDKQTTLKLLTGTKATGVVEIGCGDGWLLAQLREHGLKAIGVEINPKEVESARKNGLSVFFPDEVSSETSSVDWLCLLQTIEHVENPVAFIKGYIDKFKPRSLIISAPCFESLLGFTKDPLSWPPHHATAWSKKAFETLGLALGFSVVKTAYSPLSYDEFCNRVRMEGANKLPGLPRIPSGRIGRYLFRAAQKIGLHWAVRGHSILVVMERNQ